MHKKKPIVDHYCNPQCYPTPFSFIYNKQVKRIWKIFVKLNYIKVLSKLKSLSY
jgi:hypothetical protein